MPSLRAILSLEPYLSVPLPCRRSLTCSPRRPLCAHSPPPCHPPVPRIPSALFGSFPCAAVSGRICTTLPPPLPCFHAFIPSWSLPFFCGDAGISPAPSPRKPSPDVEQQDLFPCTCLRPCCLFTVQPKLGASGTHGVPLNGDATSWTLDVTLVVWLRGLLWTVPKTNADSLCGSAIDRAVQTLPLTHFDDGGKVPELKIESRTFATVTL